jgi:hypothetical protein
MLIADNLLFLKELMNFDENQNFILQNNLFEKITYFLIRIGKML